MAVYNGGSYVAEAVESVLAQTHEAFEFLVVDDRSTDGTREVVEGYARGDTRVRLLANEANLDQPASLNRALKAARHEWAAVIDADDVWMPRKLEAQLSALAGMPTSVRVLGTYAVKIDPHGAERGLKAVGPRSEAEFRELRASGGTVSLVHPSALMHRPTVLALGGYDPAFGPSADTELWSRVSDEHTILTLTEPLLCYRVHPNSMSAQRFFEQRRLLRFIASRQDARRRDISVPTVKNLQRDWYGRPSLRRLNHAREDRGQHLLMLSSMRWRENRRPHALLLRTVALALTPLAVIGRIRPGSDPD